MNELVPKTTSRTVALSVSDKAIVPDFYSGATGLSGRFSEGFLLRRFQASVCKRPVCTVQRHVVSGGRVEGSLVLLEVQKEFWSGRRDCRGAPSALDAGRKGGADSRSGSRRRPGFNGCAAAWDFEEPACTIGARHGGRRRAARRCPRQNLSSSASYAHPAKPANANGGQCRSTRGAGPALAERAGVMEIDLPHGVRVRVDGGVNEKALRRVLSAVRGRDDRPGTGNKSVSRLSADRSARRV